jgi:hypothetical protein
MKCRSFGKLGLHLLLAGAFFGGGSMLQAQQYAPPSIVKTQTNASQTPVANPDGQPQQDCPTCNCNASGCSCLKPVDWKKTPGSIRPLPPPGNFPIPRKGCGYYSLADQLNGHCQAAPGKSGYPPFALMAPSFFDADFRYLESVDIEDRTLVEKLKRIPVTDKMKFSTGGQVWSRLMSEHNSRLTETDNSYVLNRVRTYGDLMYGDRLRFFAEFIWADSWYEDLAPLPIDVNRGDLLNLFVDVNVFDFDGTPVYARVGRQELLLGSQRLVSTLDWANTRRTFEGARLFSQGEKWNTDLFYTYFVPPDASSFDQRDENQQFAGAWATYRPKKGHFVDFYYLYSNNDNNVVQQRITRAPSEVNTLGTRYAGDEDGFLWEYEMALQFGNQNGADLLAGAGSAGVGRNFKNALWTPTLWTYYDYASGDADPTSGDVNTFNQTFPFGHYYLGWADQIGRQNIQDANAHLFFYPQPWMTVWMQYHHFWLNHSQDALYNAGGIARRRDATGASGTNVGDEIDFVMNFHLDKYSDVLFGYSKLFGGGFLNNTSGANEASNTDLFHLMYQRKF